MVSVGFLMINFKFLKVLTALFLLSFSLLARPTFLSDELFEGSQKKVVTKTKGFYSEDEGLKILVDDIQIEGSSYFSKKELLFKILNFIHFKQNEKNSFIALDRGDIDDLILSNTPKKRSQRVNINSPLMSFDIFNNPIVYNEKLFLKTVSILQEHYKQRGFLNVHIFGPKIIVSKDQRFVKVGFLVKEGKQIKVENIYLKSFNEYSLADLVKNSPIKKGDHLDLDAVEKLRAFLEEALFEKGYPFAKVRGEAVASSNGSEASIYYKSYLGEKVSVGNVKILGSERTKDQLINNQLQLKKGDLISHTKLADAKSRLLKLDLFSHVDLQIDENSQKKNERDLIVKVKERPRTTLEIGLGASLEDGPRFISMLQHRNLFGYGVNFRGRFQLNYPALFFNVPFLYTSNSILELQKQSRLSLFEGKSTLALEYPKIYSRLFEADAFANLSALREIKPAFILNKFSSLIKISSKINEKLRLAPSIEAEYANFNCISSDFVIGQNCGDKAFGITKRLDAGSVKLLSFNLNTAFDTRDDPFAPQSGYIASLNSSLGLGWSNLMGKDREFKSQHRPINYAKFSTSIAKYIPFSRKLTLVASFKAGMLFNLSASGYVPLFKRFYLGGTNSIRGFAEDQILPADVSIWPASSSYPSDNLPLSAFRPSLGGNFFVNKRIELRFPLAKKLAAGVFLDAGQLLEQIENYTTANMAVGTGFGIKYKTSIGTLAADLGVRIFDGRRRVMFDIWEMFGLHFSIGQS
ncbi:BamA/TamA family outer membrane protein [Sulfobacillus acidophilus]|uniref:BamA/TamA family outer membrane protein n=1 Tax=Sulfobacillus acidophilus TaxID=53633 RepID=A0ABS3AYW3_9FIRM|nr:BamA/TamA family outer membrane protein [Sulfobacillus acidophilus]